MLGKKKKGKTYCYSVRKQKGQSIFLVCRGLIHDYKASSCTRGQHSQLEPDYKNSVRFRCECLYQYKFRQDEYSLRM